MTPSILEIALKSSAIIAVAAVATGLMQRRASASERHLVWALAVSGLLVWPIGSAMLPSWRVPIGPEAATISVVPQTVDLVSPSLAVASTSPAFPPAADTAFRSMPWGSLLLLIYVTGVAVLLGRLGLGYWRTRRTLSRTTPVGDIGWLRLLDECAERLGIRRPIRLVRSREEAMPMTCGVRRPAIVIPSIADMWDEDRRRAVILHELAHVARLDCLTQTLAEAVVAVYWPHPGVWWTARRLRVERELACDDCVISSGTEPRDYAGHLLEIAHSLGGCRAPALAVSMARPRQLEGRMVAMLDATRNRKAPASGRRWLAGLVAGVVVAPLAAATIVPVASAVSQASQTSSSAPVPPAAAAQNRPATALDAGTWQIRLAEDRRSAHLTISIAARSSYGTTIALDRVEGLAAILTGPGGPARYSLKRDAGTFDFEGVVRSGAGGGTFSFAPSASFGDELVKRGFSRPTPLELGTLAWSDIGFAFIDELNAMKYERPTLQQLVNGAQHGVNSAYLRAMSELGYRVGTIDALIRLRDHGVDPAFVRDIRAEGFAALAVDALVRMRDHGIDPAYIRDMRALGYGLNLDQLVDARNHGIDPAYVRDMRAAGFAKLSLDDLVNARNHGIDAGYIRELRQLDYQLTLDELVAARNHGIDSGFIKEMASAGYPHLSMTDLISLRNHGVNAKTVERLKSRGIDHPSIDRLIELQNRGASADGGPPLLRDEGVDAPPRLKKVPWAKIHEIIRRWLS